MATGKCIPPRELINNETYWVKTRCRLVPKNAVTLQNTTGITITTVVPNKQLTVSNISNNKSFNIRNSVWLCKSKTDLKATGKWFQYCYLKDGTNIGMKTSPIISVKNGDYYYSILKVLADNLTDIRYLDNSLLPINNSYDSDVEVECYRVNDEMCHTEQDYVKWFRELPILTTTKTLKINWDLTALNVSDETRKIATDKGWTLA